MSTDEQPISRAQRLQTLQEIAAKILAIPSPSGSPLSPPPSAEPAQPQSPADPLPASGNAAVDRCLAAYHQARHKALAAQKSSSEARSAAKQAYLRAMPPLIGQQNVADFIACVMRATIEDIIFDFQINKYLYAAQVANGIKPPNAPAPKRPQGRPAIPPKSASRPRPRSNASVNCPGPS